MRMVVCIFRFWCELNCWLYALTQNFEVARDTINKIKEAIDNQTFAVPLQQLQQRAWLLHWALFVFFNHENGRNDLIDLFMSPPYLAAIQINAQHLLRCGENEGDRGGGCEMAEGRASSDENGPHVPFLEVAWH